MEMVESRVFVFFHEPIFLGGLFETIESLPVNLM